MKDITEQLRDACVGGPECKCPLREAADLIDAQRKWAQDMVSLQASGGRLDGYREMAQRIADLEAENERLRGHFKRIAQLRYALDRARLHGITSTLWDASEAYRLTRWVDDDCQDWPPEPDSPFVLERLNGTGR